MSAAKPRPYRSDGLLHGVVVGMRRGDGRWLLIRRSAHVAAPRTICFPGGAIEHGESHEDAARREALEELNLRVRPIRRVWTWRSPDRPLLLFGWLAEAEGFDTLRPDPLEVEEPLWLTAEEAAHHPDRLHGTEFFVRCLVRAVSPSL